jgi:predicted nuclease of predicted toxin-antitoxin system
MKLLFDQNLSFKLCQQLADRFPGSSHVVILGLEKADDQAVWRHAAANGFLLVSLDADFAEMATLLGPPPKVIWLRCGNQPTRIIERLLRRHADAIVAFASDDVACLEIYETGLPGPLAEPP